MELCSRVKETMTLRSSVLALFLALCLFVSFALGQTPCFGVLKVNVGFDPSIYGSIKPLILKGFDIYVNGIQMGSTDSNGLLSIPARDLPNTNQFNISATKKI
jgi:hypothetical protein